MAKKRQRAKGTGTLYRRDPKGPWIARWFDHEGRRREASTHTTERAAAERILAKRIADAAIRKDGVVDARDDRYAAEERRPLSDHLDEWKAALGARNNTPQYVDQQVTRARTFFARMKAERLSEVTLSRAQAAMTDLRRDGRTGRTLNYYAQAAGQFTRWCRRDRRIRENPLEGLTRSQTATDRKYERRALDADELRLLVDAAERGPAFEELDGTSRAMLYRVAGGSGFRASELVSLTPRQFRLDDDPPSIVMPAAKSKRRRDEAQPIQVDLAESLRVWLADHPISDPLWPGKWRKQAAHMIRADLRRAKAWWIREAPSRVERRKRREAEFLAEEDSGGRLVDFHALRVTYVTLLVKGGASVKVAQELARHSTPTLTLNVYAKLGVHDLKGALNSLPKFPPTDPEPNQLRATGTDSTTHPDDYLLSSTRLYPRQLERETTGRGGTQRDESSSDLARDECRKPIDSTDYGDSVGSNVTGREKGGDGIRTHESRICNPFP